VLTSLTALHQGTLYVFNMSIESTKQQHSSCKFLVVLASNGSWQWASACAFHALSTRLLLHVKAMTYTYTLDKWAASNAAHIEDSYCVCSKRWWSLCYAMLQYLKWQQPIALNSCSTAISIPLVQLPLSSWAALAVSAVLAASHTQIQTVCCKYTWQEHVRIAQSLATIYAARVRHVFVGHSSVQACISQCTTVALTTLLCAHSMLHSEA
jgi:hypothetical protein